MIVHEGRVDKVDLHTERCATIINGGLPTSMPSLGAYNVQLIGQKF
jgi:hypothetical protein